MKINNLADAMQALFKMAKGFKALEPTTSTQTYGLIYVRPLSNELVQFCMHANKTRLCRVTFDGALGREFAKFWTKSQKIARWDALDIWKCTPNMRKDFLTDPEHYATYLRTERDQGIAKAAWLWCKVDSIFTADNKSSDGLNLVDLVQVSECIKAVECFTAPILAPHDQGNSLGREGHITHGKYYIEVSSGNGGAWIEAICAAKFIAY
jgi:hypothetical protein